MKRLTVLLVSLAMFAAVACAADGDSSGTIGFSETTDPTDPTTPATDPKEPMVPLALRFGNVTERVIDPQADGRNTTAAVTGMNSFAIDLYSAVSVTPGNVVISPYSVSFALSMIYAGARGSTATEMADVLHVDTSTDWHEGINAYDLTLDARTAGSPTTWAAANKVWTTPGLPLRDEFLDVLTGAYGAPLAEIDFNDPDSREVINGWIEQETNNLIPELFREDSIDPATLLVLVNAIALDAPWEFPFDAALTTNAPFTLADGSTVNVPTMRYNEYLPSATTPEYQAVELPYGGGALSMVVIVPTDLAAFEANLTIESLTAVTDSITDGGIHLSLPKWTTRTHLTLNETLAALGMPTAFNADAADFSGMVDGGGLWLDLVEHEAFIEVDEEGTRAAAATGGAMPASHGPTVTVDRPFIYVIRDKGAGTILFIGRVTDPTVVP